MDHNADFHVKMLTFMSQNVDNLVKMLFLCDGKKKMSNVNIMTVDILTVEILIASHFGHIHLSFLDKN